MRTNATWVSHMSILFRLYKAFFEFFIIQPLYQYFVMSRLQVQLFFLEFRANMYMVGKSSTKQSDNKTVSPMYMMVNHIHDMYMNRHKACTCYVHV